MQDVDSLFSLFSWMCIAVCVEALLDYFRGLNFFFEVSLELDSFDTDC